MFAAIRRLFSGRAQPQQRQARVARLRARYDAAQTTAENRRYWAASDALSAAAANSPGVRRTLRNRARYEIANNSYLAGILTTLANDVVGTLPRPQVQTGQVEVDQAIEAAFTRWARRIDLASKLRTMVRAEVGDGEAFAELTTNPSLLAGEPAVELDVTLIEADQVAADAMAALGDDPGDGVTYDAAGNPLAYNVLAYHPGDTTSLGGIGPGRGRPVLAEHMLHLYRRERPGQVRGIPWITPSLAIFSEVRRYTQAVIAAAETAADFAAVLHTELSPNGEPDPMEPGAGLDIERRQMTALPAGWSMSQLKAEQPATTYAEFKREQIVEAARCLLMPANVALGDSSRYNYASGRLDHQTYAMALRVHREELERAVLDRVFSAWVDEASLAGAIPANLPPLAEWSVRWFYDSRPHVDPSKEANAQQVRLTNHTTTLAAEYAAQGDDWEVALKQRARELTLMRSLDLPLAINGATQQPQDEADTPRGEASLNAAPAPGRWLLAPAPVELQAAAGEGQRVPRFAVLAYTGGAVKLQTTDPRVRAPVVFDLATLRVASDQIPALRDHDPTSIVGHSTQVEIGQGEVRIEGLLSGAGPAAQEVAALSSNGFVWQASLGVDPGELETVPAGQRVTVNGRTLAGPLVVCRHGLLREVSFLSLGADPATSVSLAAQYGGSTVTYEEWLASLGITTETMQDTQRTELRRAYDAAHPAAPAAPGSVAPPAAELAAGRQPSGGLAAMTGARGGDGANAADAAPAGAVEAYRREIAGESQRVAAIRRLCAGRGSPRITVEGREVDLEPHAIAQGWTEDRTELTLLRASRPTGPGIHVSRDHGFEPRVLEAAVLRAGRLSNLDREYQPQVLEAVDRRYRRGVGLQELILTAAAANGYAVRPGRLSNDDLRAALQAAFSNHELSGILSNVANKFLLVSYNSVEQTWRSISAIGSVSDFKTITRYRLTGDLEYAKLAPTGEIQHGTLGEDSFTNQADTYARMLSITRKDILNDDLGALTAATQRLGRGAAVKLNDVFWTAFCDNASFFTSGRGNYFEGAGTVLAESSLTTAVQKFRDMKDHENKPLAVAPRTLLVPTALEVTARKLFLATGLTGVSSALDLNANVHAGQYQPLVSAYLGNASYGNSATAWYLLADPMDIAVIETVFLNGVQEPTVESADADFNTLGVQMRGYHDFGVSKQDYRGGVKSKGAA